jgi:molecular chaperone DnaJ
LGSTIEVPTLEGKKEVEIKPGTQHGDILRIPGKGLPRMRGRGRGDEIVHVLIEIPKSLSKTQRELLTEFAKTENHKTMPESKGFLDRLKEYFSRSEG